MTPSFSAPHPAKLTMLLRANALALTPADIGLTPGNAPSVWGLVMEMGFPRLVVSLVVLADGSVSIYLSDGGSVIGCGLEPEVHNAGKRMLHAAQHFVAGAAATEDSPMPRNGRTRFYFLTPDGLRVNEVESARLDREEVDLSKLYYIGHSLIETIESLSAGYDLVDEIDASKQNERHVKRRGRGCRIPSYVGNAVRRSHT